MADDSTGMETCEKTCQKAQKEGWMGVYDQLLTIQRRLMFDSSRSNGLKGEEHNKHDHPTINKGS